LPRLAQHVNSERFALLMEGALGLKLALFGGQLCGMIAFGGIVEYTSISMLYLTKTASHATVKLRANLPNPQAHRELSMSTSDPPRLPPAPPWRWPTVINRIVTPQAPHRGLSHF
jgi:hypothetical protein